jgi:hypothetical protein
VPLYSLFFINRRYSSKAKSSALKAEETALTLTKCIKGKGFYIVHRLSSDNYMDHLFFTHEIEKATFA